MVVQQWLPKTSQLRDGLLSLYLTAGVKQLPAIFNLKCLVALEEFRWLAKGEPDSDQ